MMRCIVLSLLLAAFSPLHPLCAQVAGAARRPIFLSGYATATAVEPELSYGHALGGSGGLILERSRYMALDVRGVLALAREPVHTYVLEAGPRVAPSYGRLRPYGEVLAGFGHTEYRAMAGSRGLDSGFGFTWTAVAGVDLRLRYHLEWRVAEYSYTHIDAGVGASPRMLNTGIVYRF